VAIIRLGCCPDCSVDRSELARIQLPNATQETVGQSRDERVLTGCIESCFMHPDSEQGDKTDAAINSGLLSVFPCTKSYR